MSGKNRFIPNWDAETKPYRKKDEGVYDYLAREMETMCIEALAKRHGVTKHKIRVAKNSYKNRPAPLEPYEALHGTIDYLAELNKILEKIRAEVGKSPKAFKRWLKTPAGQRRLANG